MKDSFSIAKEALRVSPYVADKLQEVNKFVLLPEEKEVGGVTTHLHDTAIFVNKALIGSEWPVPGKHCTIGSKRADVSTFYQVGELSPTHQDLLLRCMSVSASVTVLHASRCFVS